MANVLLPYEYYLCEWAISRSSSMYRPLLSEPGYMRLYKLDILLAVTNPHPVDASFRVEIFGSNGIELTKPRGPGGSGFFDVDFGFPAAATLAPRNQVNFLLDTTTSNLEYAARGWARICTSLPLFFTARYMRNYDGPGEFISVVSATGLSSVTQQPGAFGPGTPPPPRAGVLDAPFALDEAPPLINPKLYAQSDAALVRAGIKGVSAIGSDEAVFDLRSEIKGAVMNPKAKSKGWSLFGRRKEE